MARVIPKLSSDHPLLLRTDATNCHWKKNLWRYKTENCVLHDVDQGWPTSTHRRAIQFGSTRSRAALLCTYVWKVVFELTRTQLFTNIPNYWNYSGHREPHVDQPWSRLVHKSPRPSLLSKCYVVSRHKHKYVTLFTPIKVKPSIFTELVNAQRHYVQMLYRIKKKKKARGRCRQKFIYAPKIKNDFHCAGCYKSQNLSIF